MKTKELSIAPQRLRGDSGYSGSFSTEQPSHDESGNFPSSRTTDKQHQYLSYLMEYSQNEHYVEKKRSIVSPNVSSDSSMNDEQQVRNIQVKLNEEGINEHPDLTK